MFSKFKKKQTYDEELPELAKNIVDKTVFQSDPMANIERPKAQPLPSLNARSKSDVQQPMQIQPQASAISSLPRIQSGIKKVDVSRVDELPEKNERIEYVNSIQQQSVQNSQSTVNKIEVEKKTEKSESDQNLALYNASFFSDLVGHLKIEEKLISEKKYIKSEILNKNLLYEMKARWQEKKEEIRKNIKDKEMQDKILEKIYELQKLETEWQTKELLIEEYKKNLEFIENLIEEKSIELKKTIREIKYKQMAKNPFFLKSGKSIKTIEELIDVLRTMDSSIFNEHVSEMKNDFSQWIVHEFSDEALSDRVKDAYSKEDLIAILEMF